MKTFTESSGFYFLPTSGSLGQGAKAVTDIEAQTLLLEIYPANRVREIMDNLSTGKSGCASVKDGMIEFLGKAEAQSAVQPTPAATAEEIARKWAEEFCRWPLPESVSSDLCVTNSRNKFRTGTNLLTITEAMMLYQALVSPAIAEATAEAQARCKELERDAKLYHWVMERSTEAVDLVENHIEGYPGRRATEEITETLQAAAEREKELKSRIRELEATETNKAPINTNVRLFDLVRFMRSELHEANLISDEEYVWLSSGSPLATDPKGGSPSPRRLEDYDAMKKELTALRADKLRLDWYERDGLEYRKIADISLAKLAAMSGEGGERT